VSQAFCPNRHTPTVSQENDENRRQQVGQDF
jgi:hypothetical protein